ncbi:MAG: GNAT family N-acetyltransferase [Anaerolineales bacterium]|nr:GNAT family N-acetyltransferase [Anaerolineales bacterium]
MTDTQSVTRTGNLLDGIRIRQAVQSDLRGMEWEGEFQRFRGVYADVFARAQRGLAVMWVAEVPGIGLAGQAFVQLKMADRSCADGRKRAYLHSFRVRPEFRGQGLGTAMMQYVEDDLIGRDFQELTLNVAEDNPDAIRLYQRLGYRIVKRISGKWSYYDDQGHLRQVSEPGYRLIKRLNNNHQRESVFLKE